jgi:hypothetical protein
MPTLFHEGADQGGAEKATAPGDEPVHATPRVFSPKVRTSASRRRSATLLDLRARVSGPEKQPTFLADILGSARWATVAKCGYCRTAEKEGS